MYHLNQLILTTAYHIASEQMIPVPEFTTRHISLRPHLTSENLLHFL